MHTLVTRVQLFIQEHTLLSSDDHVVVGFSGGADSTALAAILEKLMHPLNFTLTLFHLNHQLRGQESDRDECFVSEWSRIHGLPLRVERVDVAALRKKQGGSLEDIARSVRYRAMKSVAQELGARKIAVGHNMDDQAETVLLNLIRGSGMDGLRGMLPAREEIVRPLLHVRREEIESFLAEEGLPFVSDSSNRDLSITRNRIRHQLLPLIVEHFNPKIREALFRLTMNIQEESKSEGRALIPVEKGKGAHRVPLSFFDEMTQSRRLNALRDFVRLACGEIRHISRQHIKSLDYLVKSGRGEVCLPGRALVKAGEGYLWGFRSHLLLAETPAWSFPLRVPGENEITAVGLMIEVRDTPFSQALKGGITAVFNKHSLLLPLRVRSFQPGDRMAVGTREKKIKEIMVEYGIPVEWRKLIPLVCDKEKVVWIPGVALDERVKVRDNSSSVYFRCSRLSSR